MLAKQLDSQLQCLVGELLPRRVVPELPEEPARFTRIVAAVGCFEVIAFAYEDIKRSGVHQDKSKRTALPNQIGEADACLTRFKITIISRGFVSAKEGIFA